MIVGSLYNILGKMKKFRHQPQRTDVKLSTTKNISRYAKLVGKKHNPTSDLQVIHMCDKRT